MLCRSLRLAVEMAPVVWYFVLSRAIGTGKTEQTPPSAYLHGKCLLNAQRRRTEVAPHD
jgi:hypothetical protein